MECFLRINLVLKLICIIAIVFYLEFSKSGICPFLLSVTLDSLIFQELQLRRHTIILLAFLASSGKCGVEILLNYRLPKGKDLFAIILQSFVRDLDLEESDTAQQAEVFKERYLWAFKCVFEVYFSLQNMHEMELLFTLYS